MLMVDSNGWCDDDIDNDDGGDTLEHATEIILITKGDILQIRSYLNIN